MVKQNHPWRGCPIGQHFTGLKTSYPYGKLKQVPICEKNSSPKEEIHWTELRYIAKQYFDNLTGPPKKDDLGFKSNGNKYDSIIRGWTKFWNEIFEPADSLDPNLIKALIATESGFGTGALNKNAYGLMQIKDSTRAILGDGKGELSDYLVIISKTGSLLDDPAVNIAAGIRWLFQKKKLAKVKLSREATWFEAVAEYKSYLVDYLALQSLPKGSKATRKQLQAKAQLDKFNDYYVRLRK